MRSYTPQQVAKLNAKKLAALRKPLQLPCAYCGAQPGELCHTKNGKESWLLHGIRLASPKQGPRYKYRRFIYL